MKIRARTEEYKARVYDILWNNGTQNGSPSTRILRNPGKLLADELRITTVTAGRYINMLMEEGCLKREFKGQYEIVSRNGNSSD
ncbi:MAG TPA: hypothetical protein VEA37_06375, partial [Flavobacterium sp.]|nr:hypothetical protein [Flavobacterium sp.]